MRFVTVKVRIVDNLSLEALFPWRGYQSGDPLRCIHESAGGFIADDFVDLKAGLYALADEAFTEFNKDNRPTGSFAKAMSIGDIVQLYYGDGVLNLACGPYGWRDVGDIGVPDLNKERGPYQLNARSDEWVTGAPTKTE